MIQKKVAATLLKALRVKNSKIPNYLAAIMTIVGGMLEALGSFIGIIPVVGPPLSIIEPTLSLVIFGIIWFPILGVSYLGGKKSLLKIFALGGGTIVEFIPFVNVFVPGVTVSVLGVILGQRLEEVEEEAKKKEQKPSRAGGLLTIRMGGARKIAGHRAKEAPAEYAEAA